MNVLNRIPGSRLRQQGAVLFLALTLLLVMTMLILASVRGTVMQERMAASLFDRNVAFQVAEAALREAERWVLASPPKPPDGSCDGAGNCGKPDPGATPVWEVEANWATAHHADDGHGHAFQNAGTLAVPPQFIVELLADSVPEISVCESTSIDPDAPCFSGLGGLRFRITARSGDTGRAVVVLQSIYAVPKPAGW